MSSEAYAEYEARIRDIEDDVLRTKLGLSGHEKECAIRYEELWREVKSTNCNIQSTKRDMRWATLTLITGMAAILAKLVFFT